MQQQAILVLGMHRGGTSALAGALVQLGIDAPRTLMPASPSNELGYWESAPISHYHDRLLGALGTSWDAWTPVCAVEAFPQREAYARELAMLVAQEYGSSARFVVKDPRMCRLVPFWMDVLATARVTPTCVIIVRSPAEVARSLAVRDHLPPQLSALLWLRHMLDAEAATRTLPRAIVSYGDLLEDWPSVMGRVAAHLDLNWPAHALDTDQPVGRYLRPELRHHVVVDNVGTGVPPPVSEWLASAVAAFDRLAAGDLFDHGRLFDDIRAQLDQAAASFGMAADGLRASERREFAQAQVERDTLDHRVAALAQDVQTLRLDAMAMQNRCTAAQERAAQLEEDRDHLRQKVATLDMQRDQLTRQLEAALQERAATQHHLSAVLSSLSWQITSPARAGLTAVQRLLGTRPSSPGR